MNFVKHVSVLLLCLLGACKFPILLDPFPNNGQVPTDLAITLTRTVCKGPCPAYRLTVTSDGLVNFEGTAHTLETKGSWKIDQGRLQQLIAEFRKARFFDYDDVYHDDKNCPIVYTDAPNVTTSIRINGSAKQVIHNHGCEDKEGRPYPPGLTELERKIDEITGSSRWVGSK
jgi:hypothetical protein